MLPLLLQAVHWWSQQQEVVFLWKRCWLLSAHWAHSEKCGPCHSTHKEHWSRQCAAYAAAPGCRNCCSISYSLDRTGQTLSADALKKMRQKGRDALLLFTSHNGSLDPSSMSSADRLLHNLETDPDVSYVALLAEHDGGLLHTPQGHSQVQKKRVSISGYGATIIARWSSHRYMCRRCHVGKCRRVTCDPCQQNPQFFVCPGWTVNWNMPWLPPPWMMRGKPVFGIWRVRG